MYEAIKIIQFEEKTYAVLILDDDYSRIFYQEIQPCACEAGEVLLDARPIDLENSNEIELASYIKRIVGEIID